MTDNIDDILHHDGTAKPPWVDWTTAAPADPIADLLKWQEQAKLSAFALPGPTMHMSTVTKAAYEAWIEEYNQAMDELHALPWWRLLRKYTLRRYVRSNRVYRLCPPLYYLWTRKTSRLRWKYQDWKHRNDPYWDL